MCKIKLEYNQVESLWWIKQSQFQSLTMALHDLEQMAKGYKLFYVLDAYDFAQWFFNKVPGTSHTNPYQKTIKRSWNTFFRLSDGQSTCAVLSPFTLIEFLARLGSVLNDNLIRQELEQNKEIVDLLNQLTQEKQFFEEIPQQYQENIRDLVARVIDFQNTFKLFSPNDSGESDSFHDIRILMQENKVRYFDPPVPVSAQVSELLEFDEARTIHAIQYLRLRRAHLSKDRTINDTLDAYHYILIQNSRKPWNVSGVIPNLTSSGILTRNSWYILEYTKLPDPNELLIPPDWNVRSGDVPALLLSALKHSGEKQKTFDFLEDARSLARIIVQDISKIPEFQNSRQDKNERARLKNENPYIEISSDTIKLIKRLDDIYLTPMSEVARSVSPESNLRELDIYIDQESRTSLGDMPPIKETDIKMLEEYIVNPDRYKKMQNAATNEVKNNVQKLKLPEVDLRSFIYPMGEGADELISSIDNFLE